MYPLVIHCYPMNSRALSTPVPVRFSRDVKDRICAAAERFGMTASDIVRRAVEKKLPEWERDGVIVIGDESGIRVDSVSSRRS